MKILEQLRNLHDDIVFRHCPDLREYAPKVLSVAFMVGLLTMATTNFASRDSVTDTIRPQAVSSDPTLGPTLRLSRATDRAEPATDTARARMPGPAPGDPRAPMRIAVDPESHAVHASAGTIKVLGTPMNIGSWSLD